MIFRLLNRYYLGRSLRFAASITMFSVMGLLSLTVQAQFTAEPADYDRLIIGEMVLQGPVPDANCRSNNLVTCSGVLNVRFGEIQISDGTGTGDVDQLVVTIETRAAQEAVGQLTVPAIPASCTHPDSSLQLYFDNFGTGAAVSSRGQCENAGAASGFFTDVALTVDAGLGTSGDGRLGVWDSGSLEEPGTIAVGMPANVMADSGMFFTHNTMLSCAPSLVTHTNAGINAVSPSGGLPAGVAGYTFASDFITLDPNDQNRDNLIIRTHDSYVEHGTVTCDLPASYNAELLDMAVDLRTYKGDNNHHDAPNTAVFYIVRPENSLEFYPLDGSNYITHAEITEDGTGVLIEYAEPVTDNSNQAYTISTSSGADTGLSIVGDPLWLNSQTVWLTFASDIHVATGVNRATAAIDADRHVLVGSRFPNDNSFTDSGGTANFGRASTYRAVLNQHMSDADYARTAPTITNISVGPGSAYIDVTFSAGVYGTPNPSDSDRALTGNHFDLTVYPADGSAPFSTMTSVVSSDQDGEGAYTNARLELDFGDYTVQEGDHVIVRTAKRSRFTDQFITDRTIFSADTVIRNVPVTDTPYTEAASGMLHLQSDAVRELLPVINYSLTAADSLTFNEDRDGITNTVGLSITRSFTGVASSVTFTMTRAPDSGIVVDPTDVAATVTLDTGITSTDGTATDPQVINLIVEFAIGAGTATIQIMHDGNDDANQDYVYNLELAVGNEMPGTALVDDYAALVLTITDDDNQPPAITTTTATVLAETAVELDNTGSRLNNTAPTQASASLFPGTNITITDATESFYTQFEVTLVGQDDADLWQLTDGGDTNFSPANTNFETVTSGDLVYTFNAAENTANLAALNAFIAGIQIQLTADEFPGTSTTLGIRLEVTEKSPGVDHDSGPVDFIAEMMREDDPLQIDPINSGGDTRQAGADVIVELDVIDERDSQLTLGRRIVDEITGGGDAGAGTPSLSGTTVIDPVEDIDDDDFVSWSGDSFAINRIVVQITYEPNASGISTRSYSVSDGGSDSFTVHAVAVVNTVNNMPVVGTTTANTITIAEDAPTDNLVFYTGWSAGTNEGFLMTTGPSGTSGVDFTYEVDMTPGNAPTGILDGTAITLGNSNLDGDFPVTITGIPEHTNGTGTFRLVITDPDFRGLGDPQVVTLPVVTLNIAEVNDAPELSRTNGNLQLAFRDNDMEQFVSFGDANWNGLTDVEEADASRGRIQITLLISDGSSSGDWSVMHGFNGTDAILNFGGGALSILINPGQSFVEVLEDLNAIEVVYEGQAGLMPAVNDRPTLVVRYTDAGGASVEEDVTLNYGDKPVLQLLAAVDNEHDEFDITNDTTDNPGTEAGSTFLYSVPNILTDNDDTDRRITIDSIEVRLSGAGAPANTWTIRSTDALIDSQSPEPGLGLTRVFNFNDISVAQANSFLGTIEIGYNADELPADSVDIDIIITETFGGQQYMTTTRTATVELNAQNDPPEFRNLRGTEDNGETFLVSDSFDAQDLTIADVYDGGEGLAMTAVLEVSPDLASSVSISLVNTANLMNDESLMLALVPMDTNPRPIGSGTLRVTITDSPDGSSGSRIASQTFRINLQETDNFDPVLPGESIVLSDGSTGNVPGSTEITYEVTTDQVDLTWQAAVDPFGISPDESDTVVPPGSYSNDAVYTIILGDGAVTVTTRTKTLTDDPRNSVAAAADLSDRPVTISFDSLTPGTDYTVDISVRDLAGNPKNNTTISYSQLSFTTRETFSVTTNLPGVISESHVELVTSIEPNNNGQRSTPLFSGQSSVSADSRSDLTLVEIELTDNTRDSAVLWNIGISAGNEGAITDTDITSVSTRTRLFAFTPSAQTPAGVMDLLDALVISYGADEFLGIDPINGSISVTFNVFITEESRADANYVDALVRNGVLSASPTLEATNDPIELTLDSESVNGVFRLRARELREEGSTLTVVIVNDGGEDQPITATLSHASALLDIGFASNGANVGDSITTSNSDELSIAVRAASPSVSLDDIIDETGTTVLLSFADPAGGNRDEVITLNIVNDEIAPTLPSPSNRGVEYSNLGGTRVTLSFDAASDTIGTPDDAQDELRYTRDVYYEFMIMRMNDDKPSMQTVTLLSYEDITGTMPVELEPVGSMNPLEGVVKRLSVLLSRTTPLGTNPAVVLIPGDSYVVTISVVDRAGNSVTPIQTYGSVMFMMRTESDQGVDIGRELTGFSCGSGPDSDDDDVPDWYELQIGTDCNNLGNIFDDYRGSTSPALTTTIQFDSGILVAGAASDLDSTNTLSVVDTGVTCIRGDVDGAANCTTSLRAYILDSDTATVRPNFSAEPSCLATSGSLECATEHNRGALPLPLGFSVIDWVAIDANQNMIIERQSVYVAPVVVLNGPVNVVAEADTEVTQEFMLQYLAAYPGFDDANLENSSINQELASSPTNGHLIMVTKSAGTSIATFTAELNSAALSDDNNSHEFTLGVQNQGTAFGSQNQDIVFGTTPTTFFIAANPIRISVADPEENPVASESSRTATLADLALSSGGPYDPDNNQLLTAMTQSTQNAIEVPSGYDVRLGNLGMSTTRTFTGISNLDEGDDATSIVGSIGVPPGYADEGVFEFNTYLPDDANTAYAAIPLANPISGPNNKAYYKYMDDRSPPWDIFVRDSNNDYWSAPGTVDPADGSVTCPSPVEPLEDIEGNWRFNNPGMLIVDDQCVLLKMTDRGPNDADNALNALVTDPGAPGRGTRDPRSSGSGIADFWFLAALLGLVALPPMIRRYRLRRQ